MFTMCDVYSVHLVWKIYYNYRFCKEKNILKGEVLFTVNSTTPIRLSVAYSISGSKPKRKYNYSMMAAKLKYTRTSITTMQNLFR
jgi:hypothetical protein